MKNIAITVAVPIYVVPIYVLKEHEIKSGGIFSSHPDFEDRIKAVKEYRNSLNIDKQPENTEGK